MHTEDESRAPGPERRPTCGTCRRPTAVCYCAHVIAIPSATRVVLLQHPREEDRPIGTAHMASLCLPSAEVHVGVDWSESRVLEEILSDSTRKAYLLYPGDDALDIVASPPSEPATLVVVDGTWAQAKKMVKTNPRLAAMPRVSFVPPSPSEYRIRREPKETYLSTIESLVLVLGAMEGDHTKFAPMLEPFRAMVDRQIACEKTYQGARRRRKRNAKRSPRTPIPDVLVDASRTRVCVTGEVNAWPYDAAERRAPDYLDEVVVWTAERLETGERFSGVGKSTYPLAVGTPRHAEVSRERIEGGASRDAFLRAWAAFLRESDVLCSWGHHAPALLLGEGGALPADRVDLRSVSRLVARGKVGTIEEHGESLALSDVSPLESLGRAARRLALLVGIARHVQAVPRATVPRPGAHALAHGA
jgi:DTW domain-containing protein YfiP